MTLPRRDLTPLSSPVALPPPVPMSSAAAQAAVDRPAATGPSEADRIRRPHGQASTRRVRRCRRIVSAMRKIVQPLRVSRTGRCAGCRWRPRWPLACGTSSGGRTLCRPLRRAVRQEGRRVDRASDCPDASRRTCFSSPASWPLRRRLVEELQAACEGRSGTSLALPHRMLGLAAFQGRADEAVRPARAAALRDACTAR